MEDRLKASHEYTSLEQGVLTDENNVLLTICEDSVESRDFLSRSEDHDELTNVVGYRLMDKTKNDLKETKTESGYLHKTDAPVQIKNNCDFFLIKANGIQTAGVGQTTGRTVPRPIAPKSNETNSVNSSKRSFVIESYKKRDDKRRATHNEVERRRRDKINSWIFRLKELIPESAETNSPTDSRYKANTADSKSQILIRACEYIKEMQEELKSLRQCLMENDNLRLSNQQLQFEINQLKSSTYQLTDKVNIKCETPTEEKIDGIYKL